jgi:hypothetical protein
MKNKNIRYVIVLSSVCLAVMQGSANAQDTEPPFLAEFATSAPNSILLDGGEDYRTPSLLEDGEWSLLSWSAGPEGHGDERRAPSARIVLHEGQNDNESFLSLEGNGPLASALFPTEVTLLEKFIIRAEIIARESGSFVPRGIIANLQPNPEIPVFYGIQVFATDGSNGNITLRIVKAKEGVRHDSEEYILHSEETLIPWLPCPAGNTNGGTYLKQGLLVVTSTAPGKFRVEFSRDGDAHEFQFQDTDSPLTGGRAGLMKQACWDNLGFGSLSIQTTR